MSFPAVEGGTLSLFRILLSILKVRSIISFHFFYPTSFRHVDAIMYKCFYILYVCMFLLYSNHSDGGRLNLERLISQQ